MTIAIPNLSADVGEDPLLGGLPLAGESDATLVERIVGWLRRRMDERLLRPGSRLPSIRQLADRHRVSRFTVVEAYERLVAQGYLESRRGSGFYVRERRALTASPRAEPTPPTLDVVWLVRAMFQDLPPERMPGSGLLPPDWLDSELLGRGVRAVTRRRRRAVARLRANRRAIRRCGVSCRSSWPRSRSPPRRNSWS
jgi:DNA-binding transcriptional MocR family regulator